MYILLSDETNQQPSKDAKFFVYGGLFFPISVMPKIDAGIRSIRKKAGFKDGETFKFHTHTRPKNVTVESFSKAKASVVDLCIQNECKLILHIISHDVIRNQDFGQQIEWAADYVIGRFNYFLREKSDRYGVCIVDNLPSKSQFKYPGNKFRDGLVMHNGEVKELDRILLYGATTIDASHANSAMDIVLGSFRYCINNPQNRDAAKAMIGKVSDLLWGEKKGSTYHVIGKGIIIRPNMERIMGKSIRKDYDDLLKNINDLLSGA